jgi:hypothetical protein
MQLSFEFAVVCDEPVREKIDKKSTCDLSAKRIGFNSASIIDFSQFQRERQKVETEQLYEKIFQSIKHIN